MKNLNLIFYKTQLLFCSSIFLLGILSLSSCAVKISNVTAVSPEYASDLFINEVGTTTPERKLYHTYEETYDHTNYSRKNILSFSKIDGNYLEGVLISSGSSSNETFQIFGRYNFDKLYIYTHGSPTFNVESTYPYSSSIENQEIFVFQIGQNGRMLTRLKYGYSLENGNIKWHQEPPYNVDLDDRKKYTSIFSSTGFISKTDNYIGEEGKANAPASQTLADKLNELKELREQNVISQSEYEVARKSLLSN